MNKRVLVAGASRGIGRSIALKLAESGFEVTAHGRAASDPLAETVDLLKGISSEASSLCFDVTDREQCLQVLEQDIAERGAFYGVVLSFGVIKDTPFPAMEGEDWDTVLRTDLDGFFNVLKPLVMPMIQRRDGGRIVSLSSLSGVIGNRGQVNYSAAKAGLIGASRSLAQELAKRKITVNCVAPGGIETEMISKELKERMVSAIPMRRLGRPEEVAGTVDFLFSEPAAYMTGQTLVLSGGLY